MDNLFRNVTDVTPRRGFLGRVAGAIAVGLRNFHLLGMLAAATATAAFAQTGAPGAAQTNRATQGVT